eukprot:2091961-Lingulodinium_polyedra.AAC.1
MPRRPNSDRNSSFKIAKAASLKPLRKRTRNCTSDIAFICARAPVTLFSRDHREVTSLPATALSLFSRVAGAPW